MILLSLFQEPVTAGGSSKESADVQKDDGVFKAPPPPPKVTKCVTIPTDLYQDQVTALKCRKEHKEVLHTCCRESLTQNSKALLYLVIQQNTKFHFILVSSLQIHYFDTSQETLSEMWTASYRGFVVVSMKILMHDQII